jgi:hypothetical protein
MQDKIKDWPIFLLFLLPIAIISGPFFSDLFIIIIDIWFINKILRDDDLKNEYLKKNKIFLFFLFFNIYIILVSLVSENLLFSLKSSLFYFRFYMFAFAMTFIFNNYKISLKYFFYSISLAIILIIISAQYDLIILKNFFNNVQPHLGQLNRVSGLFGDELIMGSVLKTFFVIFLVLFYYLNYNKKKYMNIWIILFIFLSISFTIFISGERVSIFSYLVFSMICGFLLRKKIDLLKISIFTTLTIIILFLSFDKLRERVINHTITQITNRQVILDNKGEIFDRNKNKFVYLSVHHDAHARTAISMFRQKPLIGYGPKNYRNICDRFEYNEYSCTTHPHNLYLQLLSETGLVGLFFLVTIIFNLFNFFSKGSKKKDDLSFQILSSYLIIILIPFLPSGNIFNNFYNINLYMIIGVYLYFLDYNKKLSK